MPDTIQNALPCITGAIFVLALLVFLVSLRLFRRSRSDIFWRRRREAGQRGWRLFLVSIGLLGISGMCCVVTAGAAMLSGDTTQTPATYIVTGVASFPSPTIAAQLSPDAAQTVPSPTAAEDVAESPVPTPDKTPTPMPPTVIIITATPGYTPTETPLVTFTPNATPLLSSVTPQSDARITITALDDQISDALTPVNPRTTFEAGITRIYLFVRFRNMTPGVLWKRLLYRGGEPIDGSTYLWGSETGGETYFFFGNDSGFPPGDYEIRLYIGENSVPISTTTFTITE